MQLAILGPLEVRDASGRVVPIAGGRLRRLVARLALDAGRPVSVGALVEAVWGDEPPAEPVNAVQTLVSRARRALGADAITATAAGYRLAVGSTDDVDVVRFEAAVRDGVAAVRRGDTVAGGEQLRAALSLWRGDPSDVDDATATRLGELQLAATVERIEADLAAGAADALVPELELLTDRHPLHERLTGQLLRALAAAGRQSDALARYERVRAALADELGVDPSPELQGVHLALLRGEVAAAPVTAARRSNLKAALTSFVGRDEQLAAIAKALTEHRLVTLVGPGGAGKTRLAVEAARRLDAADGVWLAELAPVTDAADVPQAVLAALGLRENQLLERTGTRTGRDATARLLDVLADQQAVLVLDNCEHLLDAAAELAVQLLEQSPALRVLTTSREALAVTGETLLAVPPLGLPEPGASAAQAGGFAAVRLFADRAAAVRPGFAVDDDTVADVVEIVRRLDGLPLAIELAAARLRTLPLGDIAARLSDRFRLLSGGSRTAMARHRTLRAVVGWSWDLLRPDERLLAERVAVFPGGVTVESAAAVCAGDGVAADDVAELLASLVDKSLLQAVDDGRRLRMLETIREYGIEQLAGRDELLAMRDRHADHVAALVTAAQQHLTTRDQLPWLARLTAERDNILAALRHRCERGDADGAVRLAIEWGGQALLLGNHADSIGWLADALAVPGGHELPERWFARALLAMAALSTVAVPAVPGEPTHDIVTLADELARVPADVHPMLGLVRVALGFFSGDRARLDAIVERGLHEGSPWSRAAVQAFRANIAENDGDVAGMRIEADRALAAFEALGERWGMANTLRTIAVLRTFDGDLAGAIEAYERAHALIREMHSREDEAYLLVRLATLYLRTGDVERARATATAAGESAEVTGARLESVLILNLRAAVERAAGNDELARTLDDEAYLRSQALPPTHPALGHMRGIVHAVAARRAVEDGDLALARRRADEAYTAAVGTDDQPLTAAVGVTLAEVAVLCGAAGAAAEMLGATVALRGAADPTDLDVARVTAAVVATLGPATAAELDARGRALDRPAAYARLDPASWWP